MIYTADGRWIPYSEPVSGILGDVNLDGKVDHDDAVLLRQFLLTTKNLTAAQAAAGDMDENGKINACDLTLLKRMLIAG